MTVVVAAVIERDGKVLVCRRRADDRHPLKWEFPGGKVEDGEAPAAAIVRELEEELGIQATAGPEMARYEFAYPGKNSFLLIFYAVREFSGEVRNFIFDRVEWAERRSLPSYDFLEGDVAFVRRIAAS